MTYHNADCPIGCPHFDEPAARTPTPTATVENIDAVIAAHHWYHGRPSTEKCWCGDPVPWAGNSSDDIRRHQAEKIADALGIEVSP